VTNGEAVVSNGKAVVSNGKAAVKFVGAIATPTGLAGKNSREYEMAGGVRSNAQLSGNTAAIDLLLLR